MSISLNPQQKKAAETLTGPVLVLAGAGAGKTMTLTARIIKLILSGVLPQNILAITFTNKAAAEMKTRVNKAIENHPKINFPTLDYGFIPFVSTFHALGVFIIREHHTNLNISKYFSIYDRSDMKRAIKESLDNLNLDPKEWEVKNIISFISKNKGNFVDLKKFMSSGAEGSFYTETMGKIWTGYEKVKTNDKALDFDDLLLESAKLLDSNKEIREHYLKKWSHIHIDEYQDTNKVQYTMAKLLTNPETKNIFAVGDDDQCIYTWRGSDIENILKFEKSFSDTVQVFMEQNYRSTKNIIEASNAVIEKNEKRYPKKLFTEAMDGDPIVVYSAFSEKEEARFIADKIKERLKYGKDDAGVKIDENDIAVLYRANFQSRVLEEAMLRENISYQVLGTKFFDRAEVKDIISYIRAAKNPESLVDIKRIINSPKRGIGKSSVVKIFAANNGEEISLPAKAANSYAAFKEILKNIASFSEESEEVLMSRIVTYAIEQSGYEQQLTEKKTDDDMERLSNIYELVSFAQKYDTFNTSEAIERFLEEVALMSDSDSNSKEKNEKKPSVKLMTIHASKGLEFDSVFVSGAEDHFFSPASDLDSKKAEEKIEEERRLFYVSMTRAKKKLFLTWANMRTIYGRTETNLICAFILDIPAELIEETSTFDTSGGSDDDEEVVYLDW
jgi:DNA helicase-2/ATP-dependent DNA helicase PcrA